jgi:hypothetical protein
MTISKKKESVNRYCTSKNPGSAVPKSASAKIPQNRSSMPLCNTKSNVPTINVNHQGKYKILINSRMFIDIRESFIPIDIS